MYVASSSSAAPADPPTGGPAFLTKREYVAGRLREMIISGELPAGTRIGQHQVAEMLHVSPTPVREAIRQLTTEGYFESAPHMGARVADPLHGADLDEVYGLRATLEGLLAREAAARIAPGNLQHLRQLCADFAAAVDAGDRRAARLLNYQLHHVVWQAAEQPLTLGMVESLWAKFPQVLGRVPERGVRSREEHASLMSALESRDGDAAEAAVRAHVASGRHELYSQGGTG